MRTTIDIRDPVLDRAKRFAEKNGRRLADVVNDALLEMLDRVEGVEAETEPFRMKTFGEGGPMPGIDLSSNASILEAEEEEFRNPTSGKLDITKLR